MNNLTSVRRQAILTATGKGPHHMTTDETTTNLTNQLAAMLLDLKRISCEVQAMQFDAQSDIAQAIASAEFAIRTAHHWAESYGV